MKLFPLRAKLFIAYLVTSALTFIVLITLGHFIAMRQAEIAAVDRMDRTADSIAAVCRSNTGAITKDTLSIMAMAENVDIWIMDLNGRIVAATDFEGTNRTVSSFKPEDGTGGYTMKGTFYGMYESEVLSVYSTLSRDEIPRGYVVLHQSTSLIRKTADQMMLTAYLVFFVMLFFVMLFFLYTDLTVVLPLYRVRAAGREYANQNLTYPCPKVGNDEIGEIALAEYELVQKLRSSADDQRRFLQNISHDFRSPLTSIRGYMVAMQDGTIPPELQGKYFNVVISETDRLTDMANELLVLTQLESGITLNETVFDINELIRDLLPTYEGRVREKNLTFEVIFEKTEQPVKADRARINQVVHNLVDNAIKFSTPGTSIDLATRLQGGKVYVSVRDHGVGIEPENQKKIWDRFFKIDPSRGKDKRGSGLGLSIVRDIIQSHHENIDVLSTPGEGTEFVFTLKPGEE